MIEEGGLGRLSFSKWLEGREHNLDETKIKEQDKRDIFELTTPSRVMVPSTECAISECGIVPREGKQRETIT